MTEELVSKLKEGNTRFAGNQPKELVKGQDPFAIIFCCSDSRVPVETVFDQPIGSLFVVRTAGHCLGPTQLESILLAAESFSPKLLIVLGHQGCGAVTAARKGTCYPHILSGLAPNLHLCQSVQEAVVKNTLHTVLELKQVDGLKNLSIHGAVYSLETGVVTFIS